MGLPHVPNPEFDELRKPQKTKDGKQVDLEKEDAKLQAAMEAAKQTENFCDVAKPKQLAVYWFELKSWWVFNFWVSSRH